MNNDRNKDPDELRDVPTDTTTMRRSNVERGEISDDEAGMDEDELDQDELDDDLDTTMGAGDRGEGSRADTGAGE